MPNVHPLLVHFPLTLLVGAVVADLLHVAWPSRSQVREAATWLYCIGALAAMAAYFSGLEAAGSVSLPAGSRTAVSEHFFWAERTTWFYAFLASFRMCMSYIWRSTRRSVAVCSSLAGLTGAVLLLVTAERGGQLVFELGVGVRPVAASEPGWTIEQMGDTPRPAP